MKTHLWLLRRLTNKINNNYQQPLNSLTYKTSLVFGWLNNKKTQLSTASEVTLLLFISHIPSSFQVILVTRSVDMMTITTFSSVWLGWWLLSWKVHIIVNMWYCFISIYNARSRPLSIFFPLFYPFEFGHNCLFCIFKLIL